ncbi:MAG: nickel pincer cofactor biosynthesis protein LarC, partial [Acidobacteriota bacterium]
GIAALVEASALRSPVKERALRMLRWVGEAEARVHGMSLDNVHFHELAAIDSIVDIVGAAAAIEELAGARVSCGTVVVGSGTVHTAHGLMPVPAPATALLLEGIPTVGGGRGELVTPTGALILKELVDEFCEQPALTTEATGYGLGRKHLADRSNSVRLVRGRPARQAPADEALVPVDILEAQLDDVTGESVGFLLETLLEDGALDAYSTPVYMKKSRPGVLVTALCRPEATRSLARRLIEHSSSLGCRVTRSRRLEAERYTVSVNTPYGAIDLKVGRLEGSIVSVKPEYEQARACARASNVPLIEVQRAALRAADELALDELADSAASREAASDV